MISWLCQVSNIDSKETSITCLHDLGRAYFIGLHARLDDMALFHWLVQNQDCWLSTTKKSLNSHQTLFTVGPEHKTAVSLPTGSRGLYNHGDHNVLHLIVSSYSCSRHLQKQPWSTG